MSEPLLTVDLGNTRCKLRLWEPEAGSRPALLGGTEIPSRKGLCGEVVAWLAAVPAPTAAAVCSVASPELDDELLDVLQPLCGPATRCPPEHGLEVACSQPHTVGYDRLFAARGALECLAASAIVVDAGTALTVDAVAAGSEATPPRFLGGAIAPGPRLLASALHAGAARLPEIALDGDTPALGRDTPEAMRAGVVRGFRGAARELVLGVAEEAELAEAPLVLTGGCRAALQHPGLFGSRRVLAVEDLVHIGLFAAIRGELGAFHRLGGMADLMPVAVRELTPEGPGGLSVLSVEGEGALARVAELAPGAVLAEGRVQVLRLRRGGELLDEALVLVRDPRRVEVHLHGSPPLVARVRALLGGPSAGGFGEPERRPASAPRTLEERAEALLASAPCEAAARILLDQAEGALRRELEALERAPGSAFAERLRALIARGRVASFALRPATVLLAGEVNAGKSTLFNLLVGHERVVVSPERGTTRDLIRERVLLGAWPVELVDSAGEGPLATESPAEAVHRAGRELSRELGRRADLILWLAPPGSRSAPPDGPSGRVLCVTSQVDRLPEEARASVAPALSVQADPARAHALVVGLWHRAFDLPADPWTPGAGVPFAADQVAALETLPGGEAGRADLLSALLG